MVPHCACAAMRAFGTGEIDGTERIPSGGTQVRQGMPATTTTADEARRSAEADESGFTSIGLPAEAGWYVSAALYWIGGLAVVLIDQLSSNGDRPGDRRARHDRARHRTAASAGRALRARRRLGRAGSHPDAVNHPRRRRLRRRRRDQRARAAAALPGARSRLHAQAVGFDSLLLGCARLR